MSKKGNLLEIYKVYMFISEWVDIKVYKYGYKIKN